MGAPLRLPGLVRTQQPQGGALPLNMSNPLTRGLLACTVPHLRINAVTGKPFRQEGGYATNTSSAGVGLVTDGVSSLIVVDFPSQILKAWCLFGVFKSNGNGADTRAISFGFSGGTEQIVGLGAGSSAATKVRLFARDDSNVNMADATSTGVAFDGKLHTVGFDYDGTNLRVYIDGKFDTALSQPGQTFTLNHFCVGALYRDIAVANWAGSTYFAAGFNRALSASEHQQLAANPYQLFKPQAQLVFLPVIPQKLMALPSITRTQQPQGPVQIDWSNPLTKGLVFLSTQSNPADAVSGGVATPSGAGYINGVGKVGIGTTISSGSSAVVYGAPDIANVTGDITCMSFQQPASAGADATAVSKCASNGASNTPFDFGIASTGALRLARSNGGYRVWAGVATISTARPQVVFATQGADISIAPKFYVEGVLDTGAASSLYGGGGSGAAGTSTAAIHMHNRGDGGTPLDGKIFMAAVWNRQLSASEIASINKNPWQLFKPTPDYVFVPAAVAVQGPYSAVQSETLLAADSSSATVVYGGSVVENASAFDIQSAIWNTVAAMVDTSAAADSTTAGVAQFAAQTETGAGTELTNQMVSLVAAQAEAGAGAESSSSNTATSAAQAETGAALDTAATAAAGALSLAETGAALDSSSGSRASTADQAETAAAIDTLVAAALYPATVAEIAAAIEIVANGAILLAAQSEAASAAETTAAALATAASTADSGAAVDSTTALAALMAAQVETGAGADSSAGSTTTAVTQVEAGAALEATSNGATTALFQVESANAVDSSSSLSLRVALMMENGLAVELYSTTLYGVASTAEISSAADVTAGSKLSTLSLAELASALDTSLASMVGQNFVVAPGCTLVWTVENRTLTWPIDDRTLTWRDL